ncbi:MAG: hypothetical protein AUI10_12200 [Actinobacteria bacterium 13_2_20CM_2_72_6]|nr:MAG: hypothetical protein AUI10_12200 [Actinobacteria bacterium 13_2_20CM_2_72_6]
MADRPVDRRQVLRALLLAAAGLTVPAACGVPTGGGPIVDGAGQNYDPVVGAEPPPDPSQTTSATRLVELFLSAVSGPLAEPEQLNKARERARGFLTDEARDAWKRSADDVVTVVRVENLTPAASGANTIVSGSLQPIGTFARGTGTVDPYTGSTAIVPVKFTVVSTAAGLRISELPMVVLQRGLPLAASALDNKYYTPQVIYFWENGRSALVPDLRYVPRTGMAANQRLTAIVKWLLSGPSQLISSVASTIHPSGTDLLGPNADIQGDRVVLNFSAALQTLKGPDLGKLVAQLQWSLQPLHRLSTLPVVLARSDYNHDVAAAALSRDQTGAALVTVQGRLLLGRADDRGRVSPYRDVALRSGKPGRPVWLSSGRKLLIVVDGVLIAVSATDATSTAVTEGVTAFAVAPDGYRIALLRQGRLQVTAMHDDADQLTLGDNQPPLDVGLSSLTGVAWSRLDRLVVAGRSEDNKWRLVEITIDGAIRDVWDASFVSPIVSVVAYPKLPSEPPGPGAVMVQTEDAAAFRVFKSSVKPEPLPDPSPSPSPSPSGGSNRNRPTSTAPFYPD